MVWARSSDPWQGFIKAIKHAEEGINRVVPCPRDMRLSSLISSVLFGVVEDTPRPVNARDLSQTVTSWGSNQNDESYDVEESIAEYNLNQTRQSKGSKSMSKESQNPLTSGSKRDCLATPRKGVLRTPASSKSVLAEMQRTDLAKKNPSIHRRSSPFIAANYKTLSPQEIKDRLAAQRQQGLCTRGLH
jgi:hypothetical protein